MADTFFCLDRSKEDFKILGEVAEGKGKTAAKMKKTGNVPRSKTRNRQTTLKITIRGNS